jgi:hypothetical protein
MPFYASNIQMLAASAAVALVFLFVGYLQARGELNHGTTIRFFRSTHGIVAKTVTASLLVAVILYLPTASAGAIFIGESGFNVFFNWAAGLAVHFYPAISFTGSFDDFARSAAKEGLAGNSAFNALPSADQDAAVSAMAGQIKDSLSKSFGVTLSASSSTSDVAYGAIENMLQGLRNRFPAGFDAGWGITLFLILRSIGVIAVWVGQFLTMIVYELLLATGIIRIAEEPQTKEVIEF